MDSKLQNVKGNAIQHVNKLRALIAKKDTKYWFVTLVEVKVDYVIYKLPHGSNLLTCSE
jgi:hypothetical protein